MLRSAPKFAADGTILRLKNTLSPMILAAAIGVAGIMTPTDQPMQMSAANINGMDVIQAIFNP